jgi:hypothetical protein
LLKNILLLGFGFCEHSWFGKKCPIQFDGRVPAGSTPASFDALTSLYNPSYVIGKIKFN